MSLYCSISATIIPRSSMLLLGQTSRYNNNDAFTLTHVSEQPQPLVRGSCSISLSLPYNNFSRSHIAFLSKFDQTCSSSVMEEEEDHKKLSLFSKEEYFKELDVAVRAVQMASSLCQRVQDTLISNTNHQVESKDDNSPVTVAGESFSSLLSLNSLFLLWIHVVGSLVFVVYPKKHIFFNFGTWVYLNVCIGIGYYIVLQQLWSNGGLFRELGKYTKLSQTCLRKVVYWRLHKLVMTLPIFPF